jgi:hypothetical protein
MKAIKNSVIFYLHSLKPAVRGITPAGETADGYELRSRGPASQGFEALDSLFEALDREQHAEIPMSLVRLVVAICHHHLPHRT